MVKPVGGIVPKVRAAKEAGITKVLIPAENWQEIFAKEEGIEVVPVAKISEVLEHVLLTPVSEIPAKAAHARTPSDLLGASPKISPGIIP